MTSARQPNTIRSFSKDVMEHLGYYVYLLLDPFTREPFYIGKGKGNRIFHHLKENQRASDKLQKIEDLRALGAAPLLEILKYGLDEDEAHLVESVAIDLIGLHKLTNVVKGHGSKHGARAPVGEIQIALSAARGKVVFDEPGILFRISRRYHYGVTPRELYDYTRSCWKLAEDKANAAKYAFAVFDNVIREVYEPKAWLAGGSTMVCYDRPPDADLTRRIEFVGLIAPPEVGKRYVGMDVSDYFSQGAANPCRYVGD